MARQEAEKRALQVQRTPVPKPSVKRLSAPELPPLFRDKVMEMERLPNAIAAERVVVSTLSAAPWANIRSYSSDTDGLGQIGTGTEGMIGIFQENRGYI